MQFIEPAEIGDAQLFSTNVQNDADVLLWTVGQSIAIGDVRRYEGDNIHWIVRALTAHTASAANAPTGLDNDTNWVFLYDANPWRMFDDSSTSQSVQAGLIDASIVVADNDVAVTSAAALNVFGQALTVNMFNINDELVYTDSTSLINDSNRLDWYDWLFAPVLRKKDVIFTDLPANYLAKVQLVIESDSDAKCGLFTVGYLHDAGFTELGAKRGLRDYSIKSADEFGNYTITPRKKSKTITITSMVENAQLDPLLDKLDDLSSRGVVYLGTNDFVETHVFGFYKDAFATAAYDTHWRMNFEIEELS